jgi:hypothetical protein
VRERLTVINHRDQPAELHLRSKVLVLPPGGTAEVDAEEASVPQVAVLVRQRLISLWPAKRAVVHKGKGKQTHSEGDE